MEQAEYFQTYEIEKVKQRPLEIAQWLRPLAALARDPGSGPSIHVAAGYHWYRLLGVYIHSLVAVFSKS